jgi:hypothetical protein
MQVEERWPCPRCGNRRSLRWTPGRYYCFNCKQQWQQASTRPAPVAPADPELQVVFTPAELLRLIAYRAAVQAGFYTDELRLAHP